jgi:hypothetical protein
MGYCLERQDSGLLVMDLFLLFTLHYWLRYCHRCLDRLDISCTRSRRCNIILHLPDTMGINGEKIRQTLRRLD